MPHTPDAVTLTRTLSPTSSSGLVVVLFLGLPASLPLNTVKVGIFMVFHPQFGTRIVFGGESERVRSSWVTPAGIVRFDR